jgi:glycosyltransferase involved in cell wall biosynthesis
VVVPAHDEGSSIARCLEALLGGAEPGEFEVVVVANGCTDDTADAARRAASALGAVVSVEETPVASKTHALRVGDQAARTFPRLYLDADVVCPTSTARALVQAVADQGVELAVPQRRLDLTSAGWPARRYYRAWSEMPRAQRALTGRGLYAFSQRGRDRFAEFPDVVADDFWAVNQVPASAAQVVAAPVTIRPPGRLPDVVRVRSRIYAANQRIGGPAKPESVTHDLRHLLRRPEHWLDLAVFAGVTVVARRRAATSGAVSLAAGRDSVRGAAR